LNSSGVFRRIDELGRIVIPVEIRRILNIKEGENLEFYINNGEISLRKKSITLNNLEFLKRIFNAMQSSVDGQIIITDREKILISSNKNLEGLGLTEDVLSLLTTLDDTIERNKIMLLENIYQGTVYIYPYSFDSSVSGFIILYGIDDVIKYNKLIKFIINYVNSEFKI